MNASGPDTLPTETAVATLISNLSGWIGDPAVLTAIASLLTALAAFARARHRREQDGPKAPATAKVEGRLSRAYETLHDVEDRIREELLRQLESLQEDVEEIDQELAASQQECALLEGTIYRCPEKDCPARRSLLEQKPYP